MSTIPQRKNASLYTCETVDAGAMPYFLLDVVEILLALRLVLKILGASADNVFSHVVYALSQPLVAPFLTINTRHVARFDGSIVLAMLAYAMGIYLLVQFLRLFDET